MLSFSKKRGFVEEQIWQPRWGRLEKILPTADYLALQKAGCRSCGNLCAESAVHFCRHHNVGIFILFFFIFLRKRKTKITNQCLKAQHCGVLLSFQLKC